MRRCPKCGKKRSTEEFYTNSSRKSGFGSWCKMCTVEDSIKRRNKNAENKKRHCKYSMEYYKNNKEEILKKRNGRYMKNREKLHAKYRMYLLQWMGILKKKYGKICCSRCGYNEYWGSIDLHHIDPKQKKQEGKSLFQQKPSNALIKELNNCVLLCKNCHQLIHRVEGSNAS